MLFTQICISKPFLIELDSKWNPTLPVCAFSRNFIHKIDLQSVMDQANQWSARFMYVWVIVLPCSRQEALLPVELWNIWTSHGFISLCRKSLQLAIMKYKWNSLMFSTTQPEEDLQGQAKPCGGSPRVLSGLQKTGDPAGSKNCCNVLGCLTAWPAHTRFMPCSSAGMPWPQLPLQSTAGVLCGTPHMLHWPRIKCISRADFGSLRTGAYLRLSRQWFS